MLFKLHAHSKVVVLKVVYAAICFEILLVMSVLLILGVSHCLPGHGLFNADEIQASNIYTAQLICRVLREKGNLQLQMLQRRRPK